MPVNHHAFCQDSVSDLLLTQPFIVSSGLTLTAFFDTGTLLLHLSVRIVLPSPSDIGVARAHFARSGQ